MNYIKLSLIILLLSGILCLLLSCSRGKLPVEPGIVISDLIASNAIAESNRSILAVYDASIDPVSKTFSVIQSNQRISSYHLPLTKYFPDSLQITGYGWAPNFWADIKLSHPFPGTAIDGFDPRVIAILPAYPGLGFNYPALNVNANNSVVLEPDGYTRLFDNLGGLIPGNANPFKAYFKDETCRIWSGTGVTEETQRWNMNLAGFGGPLVYKLVVDVSSNYPEPPQLLYDNASEPVKLDIKACRGLTSSGGVAYVYITLLDWQGSASVGGVQIEAPDIFNGTVNLAYKADSIYWCEYIFAGTITNSNLAPEGTYKILAAAWDQATGIYIYNESSVVVSDDGNLIWAKRAGSTGFDYGNSITTLSDDSIAVIGTYTNSATFGLGETNETILTSAGGSDIFIARFNTDGSLAWAKSAGGTDYDYGMGITSLSDGSMVTTGCFQKSAIFGQGEPNQRILNSLGQYDIFVAKYNPNGTLAWAKRAGGLVFNDGIAITALSDNSTIVTGHFEGSCTFGFNEPNRTTLNPVGEYDIFIARYNTNGTLAWVKQAGGALSDYSMSVSSLSDNSSVITGEIRDTATFGLGETNQTELTSVGLNDIYVARYNPDGTLAWAKRAGGMASDYSKAITSLSDNSSVITGYFRDFPTFGEGEPNQTMLVSEGNEDLFIARYNPNGSLAWAKRAGGKALYGDHGYGITSLSDDSIFITGDFYQQCAFGPNETNETVLISGTGNKDIFVARYNPDGTLEWAKRAGGSNYDYSYSITALSDGSVVATGHYLDTATFGPGEPNQTVLPPFGSWDFFIARFNP